MIIFGQCDFIPFTAITGHQALQIIIVLFLLTVIYLGNSFISTNNVFYNYFLLLISINHIIQALASRNNSNTVSMKQFSVKVIQM